MKKSALFLKITLLLAIIIWPAHSLHAAGIKQGDAVYVAVNEIVDTNLYASGKTITIDGTISGDLIAAAQTINVNGRIEGDLIAAAQTINVNGEVGGNIRVAASSINLNNSVARNLNAIGSNISLGDKTKIGWDAYLVGSNIEVRGEIGGSVSGYAEKVMLLGKIGRNVDLKLHQGDKSQSLILAPETAIGGNLAYTADAPLINSAEKNVSGTIEYRQPIIEQPVDNFYPWLIMKIFSILSALIIGLVILLIFPKLSLKLLENISAQPLQTIWPGFIILLVIPPAALIVACTIIGIPLALLSLTLWLIAIYLAKLAVAIAGGKLLLEKIFKNKKISLLWALLAGVIICWFLFAVPFVGWLASLIAICLGLGGFWSYATNKLRHL